MSKKIICEFIPLSKNAKKELKSYLEDTKKQLGNEDYYMAIGISLARIMNFLCSDKQLKIERLTELCHYFSNYIFNEIMATIDNSEYDLKTKEWVKEQIINYFKEHNPFQVDILANT